MNWNLYMCSECGQTYDCTDPANKNENNSLFCPSCGRGNFYPIESLIRAYNCCGYAEQYLPKLAEAFERILGKDEVFVNLFSQGIGSWLDTQEKSVEIKRMTDLINALTTDLSELKKQIK